MSCSRPTVTLRCWGPERPPAAGPASAAPSPQEEQGPRALRQPHHSSADLDWEVRKQLPTGLPGCSPEGKGPCL